MKGLFNNHFHIMRKTFICRYRVKSKTIYSFIYKCRNMSWKEKSYYIKHNSIAEIKSVTPNDAQSPKKVLSIFCRAKN